MFLEIGIVERVIFAAAAVAIAVAWTASREAPIPDVLRLPPKGPAGSIWGTPNSWQQQIGTRLLFGSCSKLACPAQKSVDELVLDVPHPASTNPAGGWCVRAPIIACSDTLNMLVAGSNLIYCCSIHRSKAGGIWPAVLARARQPHAGNGGVADGWVWAGDAVYADGARHCSDWRY